jgi:hypothetical protein
MTNTIGNPPVWWEAYVGAEQPKVAFECTIADVIDAIEQNGLTQIYGDFVVTDREGKLVGACAVGQAAVNLKIDFQMLVHKLDYFTSKKRNLPLGTYIVRLNDSEHNSFSEIARKVRQYFHPVLKETLSFYEGSSRDYGNGHYINYIEDDGEGLR